MNSHAGVFDNTAFSALRHTCKASLRWCGSPPPHPHTHTHTHTHTRARARALILASILNPECCHVQWASACNHDASSYNGARKAGRHLFFEELHRTQTCFNTFPRTPDTRRPPVCAQMRTTPSESPPPSPRHTRLHTHVQTRARTWD
jgi:hypothetical protein